MFHHMDGLSIQSPLKTISVLVIHLLLMPFCRGQSQLIGSSQPIVATIGVDIILPCLLQPAEDVTAQTLEWTRSSLDPSFVYVWRAGQELVDEKNPLFSGRTSLFTDELKHGNISLKLSRVKPGDQGKYQCFIPDKGTESVVELLVGAASSPVISLAGTDKDKGGVVLQCESKGWYPEPELLWLDAEGKLLSAGPTETVRGPDVLYTVSSRVTVEKRHSNSFTCRVQQKTINQTRDTHIHVPDDFFKVQSSSSPVITGLAVTLAVSIMITLALVFSMWKMKQNIKTKRNQRDDTDGGEREREKLRTETVEMEDGKLSQLQRSPAASTRSHLSPWKIISRQKLLEEHQAKEEAETKLEQNQTELQQLKVEKEEAETKLEQKQTELQQLKVEKEEAETKLKQKETQLKEKVELEKKLEDENKQKQDELQQLQEEKKKQEDEHQRQKKELETNKNKQLEKQLQEEKKKKTEEAETMKKNLEEKIREMENQQKEPQRLMKELKAKNEQKQDELQKLQTQMKQLKTNDTEIKEKQAELQQLSEDIQRTEDELKELKEKLNTKNSELQTIRNTTPQSFSRHQGPTKGELEKKEEKAEKEVETLKIELETKETQLLKTQSELLQLILDHCQTLEKNQETSTTARQDETDKRCIIWIDQCNYVHLRNDSSETLQLKDWKVKLEFSKKSETITLTYKEFLLEPGQTITPWKNEEKYKKEYGDLVKATLIKPTEKIVDTATRSFQKH